MKNLQFIKVSALLAFVLILSSFVTISKSAYKTQTDTGEKFKKVSIAVKSKVYIEQGDSYNVDIQTDDKTREKILVEYGDELELKCKPGSNINEPVVIKITTPVLEGVTIAGSSELFIEKTFTTKEIELTVAGSGSMNIKDLKADKVIAKIAGSGDIFLAGGNQGSYEDISVAGSGKLDAIGFAASKIDVDVAGSGECKVFASDKLNVSVAGSGDVYYKGKPQLVSEVAGSGKVRQWSE